MIYPAHGAGSACGKNMMKETVDTLANQKIVNYALNGSFTKNEFIEELTHDLENPPDYFPSNVMLNQEGYNDFDFVLKNSFNRLDLLKFKELNDSDDTIVIDVRNQNDFKKGFVPGSVFIGLNGAFAPWVGSIIKDINKKILLICDQGKEKEAIVRLSRVGFDNCLGFLDGGFHNWMSENEFDTIESIDSDNLSSIVESINLVDVRKFSERSNGFLKNTISIPLDLFQVNLNGLDKNKKYYVHCAGGYRSMIACSILKRNGFNSPIDVTGGFSAIRNSNFEILFDE